MRVFMGTLAVFALAMAGCAMATADRLWIVGIESERELRPGDMVHLYVDGWLCSGSVAEIEDGGVECPAQAPADVSWRVMRPGSPEVAQLLGRGTGALSNGEGDIGDDRMIIATVQ